jgi:tetratricopeptide (TPR) repeat protein
MTSKWKTLSFLLIFVCLTSCKITDSMKTIQIEIMKPVAFTIPENVKTVAIFNRNSRFAGNNFRSDTTLNHTELPNFCLDGLTSFLEQGAYFQQVKNYRDSLNNRPEDPGFMFKYPDLFEITQADGFIFLDQFQVENGVSVYFDGTYRTRVALSWTVIYKNETWPIVFDYVDTLFFSKSQYRDILQKNKQSQQIFQDASNFIGKSFGAKMIPSWAPVDRVYYQSKNPEMVKAENYAKKQDWLKAAEIWNRQTKNKNEEIAAKACYNLALACEMEGKYDLAIDWLAESNNVLTKNNFQHRAVCCQYIDLLKLRKVEIKKLEKQIRN